MNQDHELLMDNVDDMLTSVLETVTMPGPSAFQAADQFRLAMAQEFFIEREDALKWCVDHPIKLFESDSGDSMS